MAALQDASAAPAAGTTSAAARAKATRGKSSVDFRRTMIPVLLTTGVMLVALAVARWVADEETTLARMPGWAPLVLLALAGLLIGLAVLNMLLVRQQMRSASGPSR